MGVEDKGYTLQLEHWASTTHPIPRLQMLTGNWLAQQRVGRMALARLSNESPQHFATSQTSSLFPSGSQKLSHHLRMEPEATWLQATGSRALSTPDTASQAPVRL